MDWSARPLRNLSSPGVTSVDKKRAKWKRTPVQEVGEEAEGYSDEENVDVATQEQGLDASEGGGGAPVVVAAADVILW